MTDNPAPVSLTGGVGFSFEDHAAAYSMAHLLAGRLLFGDEFGELISLDFQARESGWYLDDLLVTGKTEEVIHRASISAKRGKQVTQNGFSPEFTEAVWKQWLTHEGNPLKKEIDLLCLVTGKLSGEVLSAWNDLLNQALRTSPSRLIKRLSSEGQCSEIQRYLFDSLRCPAHLIPENGLEEIETVRVLNQVRLLYFDFRHEPSRDWSHAVDLCRSSLSSGSSEEAVCLWTDLLGIAADQRSHGGVIDLPGLIRRLGNYAFSDFPDYRSDWLILKRSTEDVLIGIRCEIGSHIKLPRQEILRRIIEGFENSRITVLLGESGTGKSVLAKDVAEQGHFDRVVWLDEGFFLGQRMSIVGRTKGLVHSIPDLFKSAGNRKSLLVLDSIEKFTGSDIENTSRILESIDLQGSGSRWHVIITSHPLSWPAIEHFLNCRKYDPQEILHSIAYPNWDELAPVREKLPQVTPFLTRPELKIFLKNLKILDLVAGAIEREIPDANRWAGLSDLTDWIWSGWVQTGLERHARAGLLRKIGIKEADGFSPGVSLDDLDSHELGLLVSLEERLLVREKNGRIAFTHDLLGDWSRLRVLISLPEAQLPSELRNRAENPRWHNAIRLLGLRFLENEDRRQRWQDLYQELDKDSKSGRIAADLFLEGVIFAPSARSLLEILWPNLQAEKGKLLRRLLTNFKQRATLPDPGISFLTQEKGPNIWLASAMRIPVWPYWGPMLVFLHSHLDEVKKLAIKPGAELCQMWLSRTPTTKESGGPYFWRREAAELAIRIAREVQALKAEGNVHFSDKSDHSAYEAFLYAAPDFPDEVTVLALELARRRDPAPEIQARAAESAREKTEAYEKRRGENREFIEKLTANSDVIDLIRGRLLPPWPDGPVEMVDDVFRDACMNMHALDPLIIARPEAAKKIIMALSISHPTHEMYAGDSFVLMKHGTVGDRYEPMYFRGPFFHFLMLNPSAAIELIVKLVNFATLRWSDWARSEGGIGFGEDVNDDQTVDLWVQEVSHRWMGDSRVFGWYRGHLIDAEHVVSALMALEKWLCTEIGAGKDVSCWVDKILAESNSTAFAGVLTAVGKMHPELFKTVLKPVLSIWQIYNWDYIVQKNDKDIGISTLSWVRYGEDVFNIYRDWHAMPHRSKILKEQIIQIMFTDTDFQAYLLELGQKWRGLLPHVRVKEGLEFVIERFNLDNYSLYKDPEGNVFIRMDWPEGLRERSEATQEKTAYVQTIIGFPYHCRNILKAHRDLEEEELEKFWQTIRYIVDGYESQKPEIRYFKNAVMGGIAVLVAFHLDWLESVIDREKWCQDQLDRILDMVDEASDIPDVPNSKSETNWESFWGETVLAGLASDPSDEKLRQLLVGSIWAYHYKTTELICKSAYHLRTKLGNDFGRILNLCRFWAGMRWAYTRCERLKAENPILLDWQDSIFRAFAEGSLSHEPVPWLSIAEKSKEIVEKATAQYGREHKDGFPGPPLEQSDKIILSRHNPGLDWMVIEATYAWLPLLEEAQDDADRRYLIDIHRDLLALELTTLKTIPLDHYGELKGTPYEYERWIFELVAKLIPQLRTDERPEELWRPILDLGAEGHYWVETFLSNWFVEGSKFAASPLMFAGHWRMMIDYAMQSPSWRTDSPSAYRLQGLYNHLMGLRFGANIVGKTEYHNQILDLLPCYEKWAKEWLDQASCASAFAAFLLQPAAVCLLLPGLTWLAKAGEKIRESNWETYSLPDHFLALLDLCWSKHRFDIDTKPEIKAAFLKLLGILVGKQYAPALEFQDQLIRGGNAPLE